MLLGQMSHADHHWHATNECFNCFNCKTQLLGKPFLPRKGAVYCSIDCSRIHSIDTKEGNKRKASAKIECDQGSDPICEGSPNSMGSIGWSSNTSCIDISKFDSMSIR